MFRQTLKSLEPIFYAGAREPPREKSRHANQLILGDLAAAETGNAGNYIGIARQDLTRATISLKSFKIRSDTNVNQVSRNFADAENCG
jgi:hypothetical protein